MNLRARMNSDSQDREPMPNSDSTMTSSCQPLSDPIMQKQAEIIQMQAAEIRTLSSEKSELISAIAELRAELSSVQDINLSLKTKNDSLKNNAGPLSRRDQEKLIEDLAGVRTSLSDAIKARDTAVQKNRELLLTAKSSRKTAWGVLAGTLLCCLIAYPAFLYDVWYFAACPIVWIFEKMYEYAVWMSAPYYTKIINGADTLCVFSGGSAWILRILSLLLIFACIAGICYVIYRMVLYYKKRWCNLSLKVLLLSLAVVIVFGELIHEYANINLLLLLLITQAGYLGVLIYLDGYYESRCLSDTWEKIQKQ